MPMETLSASHLPTHLTGMKPLLAKSSCAEVSFFGNRLEPLASENWDASRSFGFGAVGTDAEDRRFVAPLPGCFTMPKLLFEMYQPVLLPRELRATHMDFLCGWTLHDRVSPSSTCTQRTIYD